LIRETGATHPSYLVIVFGSSFFTVICPLTTVNAKLLIGLRRSFASFHPRSGVLKEDFQVRKMCNTKWTNVARASLEALRLDYEDFLRHRRLPLLPPQHPVLVRFKAMRCATLEEVQRWVAGERRLAVGQMNTNLTSIPLIPIQLTSGTDTIDQLNRYN
jgi:hypothetical protein